MVSNDSGEITARYQLANDAQGTFGIDLAPGVWHTVLAPPEGIQASKTIWNNEYCDNCKFPLKSAVAVKFAGKEAGRGAVGFQPMIVAQKIMNLVGEN